MSMCMGSGCSATGLVVVCSLQNWNLQFETRPLITSLKIFLVFLIDSNKVNEAA